MDSEFPNSDEEYELMHEDEFELLRDIEGSKNKAKQTKESQPPPPTSQRKLNENCDKVQPSQKFNGNHDKLQAAQTSSQREKLSEISDRLQPAQSSSQSQKLNGNNGKLQAAQTSSQREKLSEISDRLRPAQSSSQWKEFTENCDSSGSNTKKRQFEDLFGDIPLDFILDDPYKQEEKRPRWDEPDKIIKLVLAARERRHETSAGTCARKYTEKDTKASISTRVPTWDFVAVTRPYDSERLYVRVRHNKFEADGKENKPYSLFSVPYSQLKAEAEEIIIKKVKRASCDNVNKKSRNNDDELWVNKYRPRSYIELLSDESVNRQFLHWLKLWDKVVFNRNFIPRKRKKEVSSYQFKKPMHFLDENIKPEVDSQGFPIHRIVLLSGPPGLGKTTLAHLAARHAGYNVVEINASDERSPDAFRQVLLASTQMRAVMGNDPRPNCLVLDEIDGAPAASIDLLLKFVQGKLVPKGKKDKTKEKKGNTCHRPVICICNEPYSPSLRALRVSALIIPVPEVSPLRLADRLAEIAGKENIRVNPDTLLRLAEISGCDVRSCLGALQYMGGATSADNLNFALKDTRKGLFDMWKQILTIPVSRSGLMSASERAKTVLKMVYNGEPEKLAQGIFHNYPQICGDKMPEISVSLEWFQLFDELFSMIRSRQVWSVMPYTNYAFVSWHLNLAHTKNIKLSYPTITHEVNQKLAKSQGILTAVQKSCGRDAIVLVTDIAPFLPDLLSPRLRTVSGHLHSSKERADLSRLVNVLLEFGLTFTQEKNLDGIYEYNLDPNIYEIGIFPDCKQRRMLAYAVKQIIVQELEAERLRRAVIKTGISKTTENETSESSSSSEKRQTESKLPSGKADVPKSSEPPKKNNTELKAIVYKDFFGRPIVNQNQDGQRKDKSPKGNKLSANLRDRLTKHGVWYKYKEGFSNAVRRNVLMEELL